MKKESMIGRRLYAWIIDTFLLFVFVFFIDGLISTPIMEKTTNINEVLDSYIINSNEYNKLQDEYEIYIYEGENRVLNENLTNEERQEYLNDERVIEVTNKLYEEQKILLKTLITRISLSILAGALITYIFIPLILLSNVVLTLTSILSYIARCIFKSNISASIFVSLKSSVTE